MSPAAPRPRWCWACATPESVWLDLIRSEGGQEDRDHSIELGTSLRF